MFATRRKGFYSTDAVVRAWKKNSSIMTTRLDPLSQMIEAACEAAIKRAMSVSDLSPRRLLTAQEAAVYLVSIPVEKVARIPVEKVATQNG
jgi:hypothetical protein